MRSIRRQDLFAIATWLACACLPGMSPAAIPVYPRYEEAVEAYFDARPEAAAGLVDKYLADDRLSSSERVDGLILRAFVETALGQLVAARVTLESVLAISPKHRLDPDKTPPALMRVYFRILFERGDLGFDWRENTVAIPRFLVHSTDPDLQPLGEALSDALISDATRAEGVVVVERERLNFLIEELSIPDSLQWLEPQQLRVGKILGARHVLFGSLTPFGDRAHLVLRLVETQTSKVVPNSGVNVNGKLEGMFELLQQAAREVLDDLGALDPGPTEDEAALRALQEYSLGLEQLHRDRLDEAYAHFQSALAISPGYSRAQTRLTQIAPLVAGR